MVISLEQGARLWWDGCHVDWVRKYGSSTLHSQPLQPRWSVSGAHGSNVQPVEPAGYFQLLAFLFELVIFLDKSCYLLLIKPSLNALIDIYFVSFIRRWVAAVVHQGTVKQQPHGCLVYNREKLIMLKPKWYVVWFILQKHGSTRIYLRTTLPSMASRLYGPTRIYRELHHVFTMIFAWLWRSILP